MSAFYDKGMTTNTVNTPIVTERLATTYVGLEIRTTNARESDPATAKIGAAWQTFFANNPLAQIPQPVLSSRLYGLYTRFESDYQGEFSVVIGAEVAPQAYVPDGLSAVHAPASKYLVFTGHGEMPQTVLATWQQIWAYFSASDCPHQRSYQTDFEQYDSTRPNTIEIYIGITS